MFEKRINLNAEGTEYTFEGAEDVLKISLLDLEEAAGKIVSMTRIELKNMKPQFLVQVESNGKTTYRNHYKTISGAIKKYSSMTGCLV